MIFNKFFRLDGPEMNFYHQNERKGWDKMLSLQSISENNLTPHNTLSFRLKVKVSRNVKKNQVKKVRKTKNSSILI